MAALAAVWLVVGSLAGCAAPVAPPAPRSDAAADLAARFAAALEGVYRPEESAEAAFPGATAAFALPDGRVMGFAIGHSDREAGVAMTADMVMPAGSIGKTFVAALALSLARDGALSLDDPIAKWLGDEEWFERLPSHKDITLRMLLNQTSGLPDHVFEVPGFQTAIRDSVSRGDGDAYLTPRELVEFILDAEPLSPAGERFHYTDTGYILAGMVLEKAGGAPYYRQIEERFLRRLHLDHTLPQDRRSVPGLAQGHAVLSAEIFGLPPKLVADGEMVFNPLVEWTGGGLYSNPQDLVRWARALYEGEALAGNYLFDLIFRSIGALDPERPEVRYGLGVAISDTPAGLSYGHMGFFPGYVSTMQYFPADRVAVALQINTDAEQPQERVMPLVREVLDGLDGVR